jgi:saccharopine dehydrogenase-like NADP-dependent oxidoreductase
LKTLILGGYGNFGARICRALAFEPSMELMIGGRDLLRAKSLAVSIGGNAIGVALDHTKADFSDVLKQLGIELLIHTAGPFQQQDYQVAKAAAKAGAHYIDLADGRRFVCDFNNNLDEIFRTAGRVAISGASTVPALSSAVVDHLCQEWQRIDSIDICIAPAQSAPRGKATLAAVLSYCGESLQVWSDGAWQSLRGWTSPQPVQFKRLQSRKGALCDIPDLELFPRYYNVTQRVMFRAAVEVDIAQSAFTVLATLRAWGILPNPARLAGLLNFAAPALDFLGSSLGGMLVRVTGMNSDGAFVKRAWHIAADNDHGPEIPCMAAILLARKIATNQMQSTGAFACMSMLVLKDFESEFAKWDMVTDIVEEVN